MEAGGPLRASSVVQIRIDNGLDQGAGDRTDEWLWSRTIQAIPLKFL